MRRPARSRSLSKNRLQRGVIRGAVLCDPKSPGSSYPPEDEDCMLDAKGIWDRRTGAKKDVFVRRGTTTADGEDVGGSQFTRLSTAPSSISVEMKTGEDSGWVAGKLVPSQPGQLSTE